MFKKIIGLGLIVALICGAGIVSSNDEVAGVAKSGALVQNKAPLVQSTSSSEGSAEVSAVGNSTTESEDDLLLSTVSAVAAAINRAPPPPPVVINPRWSVATEVCCSTSSATFRVNQGSDSRSSTAPSCTAPAPQSSEVESTAGSKAFSFSIDSAGCGRIADGFSFAFQERTRYVFVAQFENGGVNISVFSGAINPKSVASEAPSDSVEGLSHERTIRLSNEIDGDPSSKTTLGSFQQITK